MNKEIERKYSVKYIPKNLKVESIVYIKQAFIYRDKLTLIRVRDIKEKYPTENQKYIYTLKTKGDIEYNNDYNIAKKYEIENEIPKEEFEKLIKKPISNIIEKTRITIPIENNLKVEIDVYCDYLEGLLTAEVEFQDEEQANNFQKPDWLGEELGYKKLSNRKLAEMTKDEWQKEVTKEFIKNNNIIIKMLKDNYNI
ncbi:MAG: hypothetical protein ACLUWN_03075 [Clostridia bacterium]|jgi:hypothetical protein